MEMFKDKEEERGRREASQEHNKATGAGGKVREGEEKLGGLKKGVGKDSALKLFHFERKRINGSESRSGGTDIIGWTCSTGRQGSGKLDSERSLCVCVCGRWGTACVDCIQPIMS